MRVEELLEYGVVFLALAVEWQVYVYYVDVGEVVVHVVAESRLPVFLLLAGHVAVFGLLHQHYLRFLAGNQH